MQRDFTLKQLSLLRATSIVSQADEPPPIKQPKLIKFPSQFEDIINEIEYRPSLSRQGSNFYLYDPLTIGTRRSITQQNNFPPQQELQPQITQSLDQKKNQELQQRDVDQIQQEQQEQEQKSEKRKKIQSQNETKSFQIQKKIKKRNSQLDQQPCFCRNSGCLKRYCRCFHSGRLCLKECQCVEGCLNNEDHLEQRNTAIRHVNEKCHRNKNVPKEALFKLKDCFGCNCKKTRCQTGYCECFLRKSKCTIDCQCENCENGLDEAYLESQQLRKNYRIKKK